MPSRPLLAATLFALGLSLGLVPAGGRDAQAADLPDLSGRQLRIKAQSQELAARRERQKRLDAAWAQVVAPTILETWSKRLPQADAPPVRFGATGAGKIGTYDRETGALVFSEWFFRELVECFAVAGAGDLREAARVAAVKTLPVYAHVMRDKRISDALAAQGLAGSVGYLEDELLHHQEEAAVLRQALAAEPQLFRDPRYKLAIDGTDLDRHYSELLQAASRGGPGLAAFVRAGYPGMASLLWEPPRRYVALVQKDLARQELQLKECRARHGKRLEAAPEASGAGLSVGAAAVSPFIEVPCLSGWEEALPREIAYDRDAQLPLLQDPAKLERMKAFYREQLSKAGLRADAFKPAAR